MTPSFLMIFVVIGIAMLGYAVAASADPDIDGWRGKLFPIGLSIMLLSIIVLLLMLVNLK